MKMKFDLIEHADVRPPSPDQPRRNLKPQQLAKAAAIHPVTLEHENLLIEIVAVLANGYVARVTGGPPWIEPDTEVVVPFHAVMDASPDDGGARDLQRAGLDDEDDDE